MLFNNEYISGILTTQSRFSQKYGYFEMRAKIPVGIGVWPAFWMLADDGGWPPEIDIMEGRGQRPGDIVMTTHWRIPSTQRVERCGFDFRVPDASTEFHNYGVLWQPDRIIYFIDRQPVSEIKVPVGFNDPDVHDREPCDGVEDFRGRGIRRWRISQYSRIRDRPDFRLSNWRPLTGDNDVRKILAPAICEACGFFRARNGGSARVTPPRKPSADRHAPGGFPKDFVWGTATSSYQIEGAVNEDGRGRSIWDTFAHTPGKIEDGTTGDRANEHYHRYKEDVGLIRDLGAKAYRFSIAWPRVFPEGTGAPNPKGLDFYDRLVDELLKNGIEPYATLYHWDLPQALEDRVGGWRSSDTSKAFGVYAGHVAARLSDRVKSIFTINEAGRFLNFGYGWGIDAPGLKLPNADVEPGPPPCRAGAWARRAGDPRAGARRHQGRSRRKHRGLRAGVRHARKRPRRRDRDARAQLGLPRRHPGRQIHRRVSAVRRQGRAEIHRRAS